MKRKIIFTCIVLLCIFSCKNQGNRITDLNTIDIEYCMGNLTSLKVSDFGKTIRFIPLETTDVGLVGREPIIKVLRDYIVIEAQKRCLLFSKKDGSFIASIGHFGQDPMAYTDIFSWADEKEEFLYFDRQLNQLIKYDMRGNFCGNVEFSSSGLASNFLITDSEIIGYFFYLSSNQYSLAFFDKEGNLRDTIPALFPRMQLSPGEMIGASVINGTVYYNSYGNMSRSAMVIFNIKDDKELIFGSKAQRIWRYNDHIRFKEDFVDTLYTVFDSKLIPAFVFHTGKYHWPIEEKTSKKNNKERIFVSDISENKDFIFFQCIKGLYDGPVLFNGLFDKQTGATKLGKHSDGIADDLSRFMPFTPLGMSTTGEFVSIIEAYKIMEWLDEHPEALNNENLSFLKELDEDMNPVVILIE